MAFRGVRNSCHIRQDCRFGVVRLRAFLWQSANWLFFDSVVTEDAERAGQKDDLGSPASQEARMPDQPSATRRIVSVILVIARRTPRET